MVEEQLNSLAAQFLQPELGIAGVVEWQPADELSYRAEISWRQGNVTFSTHRRFALLKEAEGWLERVAALWTGGQAEPAH